MKVQAQPPAFSRPDRVSAALLEALQRDPADHVLLGENLAAYVSQMKPAFQEQLAERSGEALLQSLRSGYAQGEHRWTDKLIRDVTKPYSDAQVQSHFQHLQERFAREGQKLTAEHLGSYPSRIYVTGSLVKGRFGAHSDIDVIGIASVKDRPSDYGAVSWQMSDERGENFLLRSFVEATPVDPSQPQPLLEVYRDGLERRGIALEVADDGGWVLTRQSFPAREPEPRPETGMIWSFADLPA